MIKRKDLLPEIKETMEAGKSHQEIEDHLGLYGDFVLSGTDQNSFLQEY